MASLALTDDAFRRVYCLHLVVSLLWTHPSLETYTRYSFARTRYGHWYYPLKAEKHSTFFGLCRVPHGNPLQFTLLFSIVLCSLGILVGANTTSPITRAASYVAWGSSMLYFARVRTHGLVHNKADTVPWVLAIFCWVPHGQCAGACQLLLSLAYASSGFLKVRKQGFSWADGKNLQRMVGQFLLELNMEDCVTPLQRLVMERPWVASVAQKTVLAFECSFPVVWWAACHQSALLDSMKWPIVLFGALFHLGCYMLFSIDFIRFWFPTYWCFLVDAKCGTTAEPFCVFMMAAFAVAHVRVHSGEHWPNSSFDLYNAVHKEDHLRYMTLRPITSDGKRIKFDLSVCSSSGATRSFGYHYERLKAEGDLDEFLTSFLPHLLKAEREDKDFVGVALVETRVILDAHGTGFSVPTERTLEVRRFPNPHGHTNTY